MGRLVVLDASVVIALLAPEDEHHARATSELAQRRSDDLVIPASAYAEILVRPFRHDPRTAARLEADMADVPIRVVDVDTAIARQAAQIRARRRGLTLGDALVLGAGEELAAAEVLTTDRDWPKVSKRARVV